MMNIQPPRSLAVHTPLVRSSMFKNARLTGGLTMFFFQYLFQAGVFFVIPLYLSVVLGLSARDFRATWPPRRTCS